MARFLFTVWPFAGHVNPCIAIGGALRARGHDVAFYTGGAVAEDLEREGFQCFPFVKVSGERVHALASAEIPYCATLRDRLRNARLLQAKFREWLLDTVPDQVTDIEAVMQLWKPDVLVCDLSLWAPFLVLHERHGIPVAVLSILAACILPGPDAPFWGEGKPRPRTGWMRFRNRLEYALLHLLSRGFRKEVNVMRARFDLPPLPCSVTEYAGRMPLYLVPSAREYDYNRRDLPPSVRYVGPCLWDKPSTSAVPAWLAELPRGRPFIYVTEATIGTQEPFLLKTAAEAFRHGPYDVVITTGKQRDPLDLHLGSAGPNIRVEAYVPQSDLMPRIDVMVTLGGSGGVLAALSAGVPLVIVPTEWDRPENAQRVVEVGAGLRIAADQCTPERLLAAVERVLHEPLYRMNAQRLAKVFANLGGPSAAASELEKLSMLHAHTPAFQESARIGIQRETAVLQGKGGW